MWILILITMTIGSPNFTIVSSISNFKTENSCRIAGQKITDKVNQYHLVYKFNNLPKYDYLCIKN